MRNHFLHVKDLWHYAEVEYGERGEVLGWDFLVKNHPDPYRGDNRKGVVAEVSIEDIEGIAKQFTTRFRTMPNAINRKNFKPDAWLKKVQRN